MQANLRYAFGVYFLSVFAPSTSQFRMQKMGTGVHRFKITLQDVKPAVWRRIQTPSSYSFWDLHVAIQDAMGWKDMHLHEFQIIDPEKGKLESIGIPDDDEFGPAEVVPGWERSVAKYFSGENPAATYVYDFGDDWNHEVILEESLPAVKDEPPVCLDGGGACPPEDCGGPNGYAEFLRAIKKPGSPRGGELLEWVGGSFDPRCFDAKDVTFDDPGARWEWSFNESVALDNDLNALQSSPRKLDRQGRIAFQIPPTQFRMVQQHSSALSVELLEQFGAAVEKNGLYSVKLDVDELKALGLFFVSAAKKMQRRLDRRIMMSLYEHFKTMESIVREM
jgi:pRiA4b ORF-3-like protein